MRRSSRREGLQQRKIRKKRRRLRDSKVLAAAENL
jgi:hypothetical protein